MFNFANFRRCKKFRLKKDLNSSSGASKQNIYSENPITGNRQSKNFDYDLPNDIQGDSITQSAPLERRRESSIERTKAYETPDDAIISSSDRTDSSVVQEIDINKGNVRTKSSGYSTPVDAITPPSDISKNTGSEYAEPCTEYECFNTKALQNRNILQNYSNIGPSSKSRHRDPTSNPGRMCDEDENGYHHFDRIKDNNSATRDTNYSNVCNVGKTEDDYNYLGHDKFQKPFNPDYDHLD